MVTYFVAVNENVRVGESFSITCFPRTTDLLEVKNLPLANSNISKIITVEVEDIDSSRGVVKGIFDARCFGINTGSKTNGIVRLF